MLDLYGEFGIPITGTADDRPDAEKMRLLADWFDAKDDVAGGVPLEDRQVQADLRRWANEHEQYRSWLRWIVGVCPGRCRYDHDDACQEHYLDQRPCPVEQIKDALP